MKHAIAVVGIDGSGKSTLIESLKAALPKATVSTIWDPLGVKELAENIGFRSKSHIDAYLSNLSHEARALFLFHCLTQSQHLLNSQDDSLVIYDGYWFKYAATELELGTNQELINNLSRLFPSPDLVVHINTPASVAVTRREYFSNYECGMKGSDQRQGFVDFQERVNQRLGEIISPYKTLSLNGEMLPDDLSNMALRAISEARA